MDLTLKQTSNGSFDLDFDGDDLKTDNSLRNAVALSIGTYARDRKTPQNKIIVGPVTTGWWGDALDAEGTLGGYLYEAFPGKSSEEVVSEVESLVLEALEWMKKDGIAADVKASASASDGILNISVEIFEPDGKSEDYAFEINWRATDELL